MERVGRYRIVSKLGEGGMGVVYAAHDEQLDRPVAIKMIRDGQAGARGRERFWREARSAARVNHPNVCQLYEIGEEQGALFIAMELLEGESLATRLQRGPLALSEATQTALSMLAALEALHRRGLIHRDLKPSNVFLTPHAVKLLDFGLARSVGGPPPGAETGITETGLTQPGTVLGTPRYIAPEQILGHGADHRADLFAAGVIIFEMLTGKPAFDGDTMVQVMHAVVHDQPPALVGSAAIAAVDRIIHRALAKRPEERYASADAMAQDLREALLVSDSFETPRVRAMTRLIVVPFRILRADPETDFLAVSLADAIGSSLAGLESLVVRSSTTAARYAGGTPDLAKVAEEAEVDVVLTGTLLRAGDQLRVNAELVEAPRGTVLWTQTSQVMLKDVFQLQDELAGRIVESLSIPLTAREHRQLKRDVPASPAAYECYLRANMIYLESVDWSVARDLYLRCVELDPRYAPAWARLGRVYRVMSKYGDGDPREFMAKAESAFRRALDINPDLAIAHKFYAALEAELNRAKEAMVRLLERAAANRADPDLFAGLVHCCRYCGLLEASVAAHEQAKRLDPSVRTSVTFTYHMLGDYQRAYETDDRVMRYNAHLALIEMGRETEGLQILNDVLDKSVHPTVRILARIYRAAVERDRGGIVAAAEAMPTGFIDPEGWFLVGRSMVRAGETEGAFAELERAVEGGYYCYSMMRRDPWLDPLRTDPRFARILKRCEERHREAQAAFTAAGGEKVLGMAAR